MNPIFQFFLVISLSGTYTGFFLGGLQLWDYTPLEKLLTKVGLWNGKGPPPQEILAGRWVRGALPLHRIVHTPLHTPLNILYFSFCFPGWVRSRVRTLRRLSVVFRSSGLCALVLVVTIPFSLKYGFNGSVVDPRNRLSFPSTLLAASFDFVKLEK